MAEGFSAPLPNKGLIILEKYTCVLQKELRQPWKLCLFLEAGGFGTLDDYYQCYSQTSFTSPAIQAHHLLNGIRMAVHRDPNSLLKFLDAMESCSLCGGVAGKMKEEYNSEFTIKADSHCMHTLVTRSVYNPMVLCKVGFISTFTMHQWFI